MEFLEKKQRTLTIDGHRQAISLTLREWDSLDVVASNAGQKWGAFITALMTRYPEEAKTNLTGLVRSAVVNELLAFALGRPAGALPQSPLLEHSAVMDDKDFSAELAAAKFHDFSDDMGGFSVAVGVSQTDRPCIWIKNHLRDHPHVAIELTVAQLEAFKGA